MKKITFLFVLLLVTGLTFSQNEEKKWALGLGAGVFSHFEDINLKFSPEIYLSRYLSPSFDLMIKQQFGPNLFNSNATTEFSNTLLNLRYKINIDGSKFMPYAYAGPGYLKTEDQKGINFDAGVGTKLALGDNISLYLEGGYNSNDFADEAGMEYGFIKGALGLEFAFGKTKDSDGDGVSDRKDKCPDTPAGVKVDLNGCPLDRDGDGIADYKDDCPDTPGLAAFNGCPDKDGDGIMDKEDDCPDVAGLKKFNGCPDTDGDGVPDPKDECPNTPKGCKVDMKGCPLDTDKDGIIDCEDQCPDVAGVKELKGCPIICKGFEVSPVYFDFAKATLRPEGMAALDAFINQLGDCKKYDIVVDGYTCSIGTKKYNLGLSEKRALEVVKYLTSKGINNAFIGSKGFGEENPALPNTSKVNREKNRRAVIELTIK
jgi:OmpA-OmpF porin, OOP family